MKGQCKNQFIDIRVICTLPEHYGEDCLGEEGCEDYEEEES